MRSDARPKAHLCGVSWRQPPAQQAEAGEGGRAADSAARSFQFGGTHILLLWAEGPRRGQEWGEGLSRGDGAGCTPRGDSGGELQKVTWSVPRQHLRTFSEAGRECL